MDNHSLDDPDELEEGMDTEGWLLETDENWEQKVDQEIAQAQREVDEALDIENRLDGDHYLTSDAKARLEYLKSHLGGSPTDKGEAAATKFQGDIGEGIALRMSTEKLQLTPDPRFDSPYHGFDAVCRDAKGDLVIVESKFDEHGLQALGKNQMQPEWVEQEARRLQQETSKAYTEGNAQIGAEIEKAGADSVRRIVLCTDPHTLETTAFEGQSDSTWKQIGKWSVLDVEQPYL